MHPHQSPITSDTGAIVTAQPFAARERGPFPNVRDYFQRAHLPSSPARLCVRVVAIDRRTGREVRRVVM